MLKFTNKDISQYNDVKIAQKKPIPILAKFACEYGIISSLEGDVAYKVGDVILTGNYNESWPVSSKYFKDSYTPHNCSMGEDGEYLPMPKKVYALQVFEPFCVSLSNNKGTLIGKRGDWLVQYAPFEYGIVEEKIFASKYIILD